MQINQKLVRFNQLLTNTTDILFQNYFKVAKV